MNATQNELDAMLEHLLRIVNDRPAPSLPEHLARNQKLARLHEQLLAIRKGIGNLAQGELEQSVQTKGFMAGRLKTLQANLRHLAWQAQQVEHADFSQRIAFMGDISETFNNMVGHIENTLNVLNERKASLAQLNNQLQHEVSMRIHAMKQLEQSEAQFRHLACHDFLTGALNRRSFLQAAERALDEAQKKHEAYSIVMLDVDLFKQINDTYGHLAGDAALQHIAHLSKSALRDQDAFCRYGGEEFIFYLTATSLQRAVHIAERIRNALETTPFRWEGAHIPLTASFGVCALEPQTGQACSLSVLIKTADQNLYTAKKHGKNRVVSSLCVLSSNRRETD